MPGVFGLRETRIEKIKNISTSSFRYWSESAKYGYFAGSLPTSPIPITRLDFSNETVSNPGKNISPERQNAAAVSSNSYGYFGGGNISPVGGVGGAISTITRLDFSNETVSDPGKNFLTSPRVILAAVSNNSYGYFGGGIAIPTVPQSICTITRLDFSNETVSDPGKNLLKQRSFQSAASNNSYGYFGGGTEDTSPYSCTITRLDFSNETVSNPGKNLPYGSQGIMGVFNNSYGYFGGGRDSNIPPAFLNTITRLDFSNETVSNPGKNLPIEKQFGATVSNNSYGYFGGGYAPGRLLSSITRLDFSNETLSNATNNLPTASSSQTGLSGGASVLRPNKTFGYFGGGLSPIGEINTITRLDFSNETVSDPTKNLPTARTHAAGVSNNSYGYFAGGVSPPSINTITRLDFSNETLSNPTKNLLTSRRGAAGVSNNSYGYFAGSGPDPGYRSTITRLDFSNEVVSNLGNTLSEERSYAAGVSNNYYGYFGGGYPTGRDLMARLDFSNETVSNPGNLLNPSRRYYIGGVSNNSYGYFGGGGFGPSASIIFSTISRLDFSNETISNPGKNLPTERYGATGISGNFYGYFGGGGTPTRINTIVRLDFSNETVNNAANNLPSQRESAAGVTNSN